MARDPRRSLPRTLIRGGNREDLSQNNVAAIGDSIYRCFPSAGDDYLERLYLGTGSNTGRGKPAGNCSTGKSKRFFCREMEPSNGGCPFSCPADHVNFYFIRQIHNTRIYRKNGWVRMKKIIALGTAILFSIGLFFYLSTTVVPWRITFSGLLFLAIFMLVDGFINYEG